MMESNVDVKIINATRGGWDDHLAQRLTENTVFFDFAEICDKTSPLPATMPNLQTFIENMQKLDVSKNARIVVYDDLGIFSVARAAWMMRYFGATNVKILNGGMKKWLAEWKPTTYGS